MRRPTIAETAVAVLTEVGPLPPAELGRRIAELGATRSKNPAAAVKQALASEERVAQLVDGRFALMTLALDGLVLTHRLTEDEAAHERVALDPDLSPIRGLSFRGLPLAGGGSAERCSDGHLHGPTGWLDGAEAGDLRGFVLREGRLEVGPVQFSSTAVSSAQEVLGVIWAELELRPGYPVVIESTLRDAAIDIPGLLREPVVPLGELLSGGGLVVRGARVFLPGARVDPPSRQPGARKLPSMAPFPSPPGLPTAPQVPPLPGGPAPPSLPGVRDALAERVVGRLAAQFGVDVHAVNGLGLIMQAIELSNSEPETLAQMDAEQGLLGELGTILAYPGVAELTRLVIGVEPATSEFLLEQLAYGISAPFTAAPLWLLARLAEARGNALDAESLDLRAISADPNFAPALLDAARAAEDRGDARTAAYFLRRAGGDDDHPHVRRLDAYARLTSAAQRAGGAGKGGAAEVPDLDADPFGERLSGAMPEGIEDGRDEPPGRGPCAEPSVADGGVPDVPVSNSDGNGHSSGNGNRARSEAGPSTGLGIGLGSTGLGSTGLGHLFGAGLGGLSGAGAGGCGLGGCGLGGCGLGGCGPALTPVLPLPSRAIWLVDKALGWSMLQVNRPAVGHLAALLADSPTCVLAQDAILFDRGMLARYLRARAQIIPSDEFELGRDWLVTERALWSIEAAHPGGHLVLRNARSGELTEVTDRSGGLPPARGELRYGRVVPDGRDRLLLNGGTHVPEPLRGAFLTLLAHQLDGPAILAWFQEIYRTPEGGPPGTGTSPL